MEIVTLSEAMCFSVKRKSAAVCTTLKFGFLCHFPALTRKNSKPVNMPLMHTSLKLLVTRINLDDVFEVDSAVVEIFDNPLCTAMFCMDFLPDGVFVT